MSTLTVLSLYRSLKQTFYCWKPFHSCSTLKACPQKCNQKEYHNYVHTLSNDVTSASKCSVLIYPKPLSVTGYNTAPLTQLTWLCFNNTVQTSGPWQFGLPAEPNLTLLSASLCYTAETQLLSKLSLLQAAVMGVTGFIRGFLLCHHVRIQWQNWTRAPGSDHSSHFHACCGYVQLGEGLKHLSNMYSYPYKNLFLQSKARVRKARQEYVQGTMCFEYPNWHPVPWEALPAGADELLCSEKV